MAELNIHELATKLIIAQMNQTSMTPDEICNNLKTICETLADCARQEAVGQNHTAFAAPADSIGRHEIACLECGKAFRLLSNRHLALHGLTPTEYKDKHGFPRGQSLSCTTLSAKRRRYAVQHYMGSELAAWHESRRQAKA